MKKVIQLVLMVLLGIISAEAKEVFGLQKQYFENAKRAKVKASSYDLDNAIVTTVNIFQTKGGIYRSAKEKNHKENTKGFLKVQLKKALTIYQVDVKVDIGEGSFNYSDFPFSVVLKSSSGNDLSLNLSKSCKIWMNDSQIEVDFSRRISMLSIAKIEDDIVVIINGKDKIYVEDETFTDLKEVSIALTSIDHDDRWNDKLYDLSISGE